MEALQKAVTHTTVKDCGDGAREGFFGMQAFFDYQKNPGFQGLRIHRLFLDAKVASGGAGAGNGKTSKRKDTPFTKVTVLGPSIYGTTLANIILYCSGRGLPAENVSIVKKVQFFLNEPRLAMTGIDGKDRDYMLATLASARVVHKQKKDIKSLSDKGPKVDYRVSYTSTAVGATIAIITCYFIMAERRDDMLWLQTDQSLIKSLECLNEALSDWFFVSSSPDAAHVKSLYAEKRICERAIAGAMRATSMWKNKISPGDMMQLQMRWAMAAAYPYNQPDISAATHEDTLEKIRTTFLGKFLSPLDDPYVYAEARVRPGVSALVPLAAISSKVLLTGDGNGSDSGASDDSQSTIASSVFSE